MKFLKVRFPEGLGTHSAGADLREASAARCHRIAARLRAAGRRLRRETGRDTSREFRDAVFEDVEFETKQLLDP